MGNHAMDLGEEYKRKYVEMVKKYSEYLADSEEEQSAFWPQKGEYYKLGGFLFIGRADKEWHIFSAGNNPKTVTEKAEEESEKVDLRANNCPLNWVVCYSGENPKIKFWGTINRIVREKISDSDRWYSYIAYSNLYKLSPKGYNPSDRQCEAQKPYVFDLLDIEINKFQPKFIISLAGCEDWTKDFIKERGIEKKEDYDYGYGVAFVGIEKVNGREVHWIVTSRHPQGMSKENHNKMINSIGKAINKFQGVC